MFNRLIRRAALLILTAAAGATWAAPVTFSGNLGDAANTALVASDLGGPLFDNDFDKANNVALHAFQVTVSGNVKFTSTGFAAGGVDPYFTLFSGVDPATATFVASNYFEPAGDFAMDVMLTPGDYTVAIGVFFNESFAENYGSGVLADGFIGLGGPDLLRNGLYQLTVTLPDGGTVPEPAGAVLTLTAVWAAAGARRRRQAQISNGGR